MSSGDGIRLVRVHDPDRPVRGRRYLVERLWPRGRDPARRDELRPRYPAEPETAPHVCGPLLDAARSGEVTLPYDARDRDHDSAVVLHDHALARLRHSSVDSDRS